MEYAYHSLIKKKVICLEASYRDDVLLLDAKKEGNNIICNFESNSKADLTNQISELNPVFID